MKALFDVTIGKGFFYVVTVISANKKRK